MVAQVKALEPGKLQYVDANQDEKPEEVWFIDPSPRIPAQYQPVLVRAIDEDNDLAKGRHPDQDSDVYVADWNADGIVNAIVDYTDINDDQAVDETAMYFAGGPTGAPENALMVWWGKDIGGDHLLWYSVAYTYFQDLCQWNCHFSGDEMFSAFILTPEAPEWVPVFENPFVFYDPDRDTASEEAIRYEFVDGALKSYRHSFDADNDSTRELPHDYDVSVTAYAPENTRMAEADTQRVTLRGIQSQPILTHPAAAAMGAGISWTVKMLTWDENDDNVDGDGKAERNERWEGVIAKGSDGFPQAGGPSCGAFNKRYELDPKSDKPVRVYFRPADHRIHLFGAKKSWLDVDADEDGQPDMKYAMSDSNGDGIVDTWSIDVGAEGTADDTWQAADATIVDLGWNWGEVNTVYSGALAADAPVLFALSQRLEQALAAKGVDPATDPVVQLVRTGFAAPTFDDARRRKYLASEETRVYYFGLIRDRMIAALKKAHDNAAFWQGFNEARGRGDYAKMRELTEKEFALTAELPAYPDWVTARRNELPPTPRVAWAQDWATDNIGWESEKIAYRAYWGQIDFYGKKKDMLLLPGLKADGVEREQDWGMDALFVRDTAGCGGVTLYVNGKAFPVRSPQGVGAATFTKGLVEQTNDKVTVEVKAANVGPEGAAYTVRLRFTAFAGRTDSAVEVLVEGGAPEDKIELGIALTRLTHQDLVVDTAAGVFGVKGEQSYYVGSVGMGVVYPVSRFLRVSNPASENEVVLGIEKAVPVVYHIVADWQRGRQYPAAPSTGDWLEELRRLARQAALK